MEADNMIFLANKITDSRYKRYMTASTVELKSEEKRNRNLVLPSSPFSRNLIVNLLSIARQDTTPGKRAPVGLLVEHRAVTREVVSSTPAEPSLRVLK